MDAAPLILAALLSTEPKPGVPFQSGSAGKRIFIEERVKTTTGASVHCDASGNCYGSGSMRSRSVSLEVTRDLTKSCPAVTVTNNRDAADYVLRISPGSSSLFKQNGDVAYVSPARFKVSNLAKDVCGYIQAQSGK
jgi:hypothetical protein